MRARPVTFSDSTGLRLCGIAEEPFCFSEKNSSASSTSVRCRWRISVASRSIEEATTPSVAKYMAWRSRGMIWVETGSTRKAHRLGDMRFDARIDLREGADRAGNGAGRDLLARGDEPLARAREFGIGVGELEAERGRLGMDAVRAADGRRHLVLEGAALERGEQRVDVGDQDVGGAHELHVEAGVEHVRRGHAGMHEARLRPDDFGDMRQEGDDVVLDLAPRSRRCARRRIWRPCPFPRSSSPHPSG